MSNGRTLTWIALGVTLSLAGCAELERLPERLFDDRTPRERYEAGLAAAGLEGAALVQDWLVAAERALFEAPVVGTGHREEGFLAAHEPIAIGWRLALRRGQSVRFRFHLHGDSLSQVFIDVWEPSEDSTRPFRRIATADSGIRELELEPRRDGDYLFRAQPELLRGGRFTVELEVAPTLGFPVNGGRESDIGSRFGAPRDGGSRRHHGVDIFARRGTPVVAAAEGTVRRAGTTEIGGNVVWLRDTKGQSLYYAHLDRYIVSAGDEVRVGDTLGFVGNTGNARTTPPHLHFGVYQRGPQDPWWYLHRPRSTARRLVADTALLGGWARASTGEATVRERPEDRSPAVSALLRATAFRIVSAVGDWYRVRLPDARTGYLEARQVEAATVALEHTRVAPGQELEFRPDLPGRPVGVIGSGAADSVEVVGRFGPALLIRGADGRQGWVAR